MINIYSIDEIVKATKDLFESEPKNKINKIKEKLPADTENIIREAEKSLILRKKKHQDLKAPLVLNKEVQESEIFNSSNYKIKLKSEFKEHMVNELHAIVKKKIKKNTLKLIIDQQVEVRNLKNRINFLKESENKLNLNYQELKNDYEKIIKNNKILEINNNNLQYNIEQIDKEKKLLVNENKKIELNTKELEINLDETMQKNRTLEINNNELKNTISRFIVNNKKLQTELTKFRNSKESIEENEKIKFYQNENVRLSSELLSAQNKNDSIKQHLNNIELEKEKISNKIKELSSAISKNHNIVETPFVKSIPKEEKKEISSLNIDEQENLNKVINNIFKKL